MQNQQIAELQPKASYYDVVLNCKDLISIGKIAKDYGWSAQKLNEYLHKHGVQYKQGKTWLLARPTSRDLLMSDDVERMLEALRALGVDWRREGDSLDYRVRSVGGPFPVKTGDLFLGS